MKKKIIIFIIVILFVISILFVKFYYLKNNNKLNSSITETIIKEKPELMAFDTVNICKDKNNCSIVGSNVYSKMNFDFDYDKMQQWISKVNEDTDKYYQESISSTLDDEICIDFRSIYNHRIITSSYYSNYVDSNYISLSVKRVTTDLCSKESKILPIEVFLYSMEKKKQITQEELKEELNLKEDVIINSIKKNIDIFSFEVSDNFDYSNYTLYYDSTGSLLAEYYLPNEDTYYSVDVYF